MKHLKEQLNKRKIKFNNTSFILTKEERYNEEFSEKQRRIRMEQIYAKDKKIKNQS